MKKIVVCLGVMLIGVTSCDKKVEKTVETTETTTVITDTVVKEAAPAEAAPKEDGTSVKIDGDGIDVNSKEVKVEIKK